MLKRFGLFDKFNIMFCLIQIKDVEMEFHLTCLGTKGIHLLVRSWHPTKKDGRHIILELLYNIKHKWGYSIIKSVFGILKKNFLKVVSQIMIECCFLTWHFYLLLFVA
jgi:hypothetical protein